MASAIACTACFVAEYAPTIGGLTTPRIDDRKTILPRVFNLTHRFTTR
jgi:hypothetical protein